MTPELLQLIINLDHFLSTNYKMTDKSIDVELTRCEEFKQQIEELINPFYGQDLIKSIDDKITMLQLKKKKLSNEPQ